MHDEQNIREPAKATLTRQPERATYDIAEIKRVFSDSFFSHVAFVRPDGSPECLPVIALLADHQDLGCDIDGVEGDLAIYLHGHPSSGFIKQTREARKNGSDVKVAVTATKVDGLALSSAPNGHTFHYRSAVIHGTCTIITDPAIKRTVMAGVVNGIIDNRMAEVNAMSSVQLNLVTVVRVSLDSLAMKIRTGGPGIEPRNIDRDGPDVAEHVWTGSIPVSDHLADPVPSGKTPQANLPDNIKAFIANRNARHAQHATDACHDMRYAGSD